MFKIDKFNLNKIPKIENQELREYIEEKTLNTRFDKKFCYYMLIET
jgi:hypothetical protein